LDERVTRYILGLYIIPAYERRSAHISSHSWRYKAGHRPGEEEKR